MIVQILERHVFQFIFDPVNSQSGSYGGIYIKGFFGYLLFFILVFMVLKGAHVVQPVSQLD